MEHEQVQEQLFDYYDGHLAPGSRSLVESHLQDCVECRDVLERWKQTSAVFLRPLQAESSETFVQAVMRKVRAYEPLAEGMRWHLFIRWALPALGVAMASFFFAFRVPALTPPSTDTVLSQSQTPDEDLLLAALEESR